MVQKRTFRRISLFAVILLLIEFLDELVFGAREAAWPLIRDDLALDYAQVGILLGLPSLIANFIEPVLGILGDVWRRRVIVLGGGLAFAFALILTALSDSYWLLLLSFVLLYPASGAFVSLAQATLMDTEPARHEQNMARWTFAGSLGVVAGTLLVSLSLFLNFGWRWLFVFFAVVTLILIIVAWRFPFPNAQPEAAEESISFSAGVKGALLALKRREVLRWLALLRFSDLMLDLLLGFLALYFVDVVGVSPEEAAWAVTLWVVLGLLGDFLIIPLLERVNGLRYLRFSSLAQLVLYPLFLLAPDLWMKFSLLALLGLFNAGWYSILQGQLYSAMPGQSGSVMAVGNIFNFVGDLLPIGIGLIADRISLESAMWILLLGPVALIIGLPGKGSTEETEALARVEGSDGGRGTEDGGP